MKQGDQLQITLEAVDIADNRTLWRDTMTVAAPDMIAMRGQITAKVRQGLVPALGAGSDSTETGTHPKNEEAYDPYLCSISLPHDPTPNKGAQYILGPFGPDTDLRRYGLRLCERGGKNAKKRAAVAVARKLAVLLHRLWVSGEVYEPLGYAVSTTIVQEAAA